MDAWGGAFLFSSDNGLRLQTVYLCALNLNAYFSSLQTPRRALDLGSGMGSVPVPIQADNPGTIRGIRSTKNGKAWKCLTSPVLGTKQRYSRSLCCSP